MIKHQIYLFLLPIMFILMAGCTDIKEVQELNYATSIGIDYQDNQYVAYVQLVSLSTLSNIEGATSEMPEIWVSESAGRTLNDALYALYNTAQERIIWSHVSSVVLTESAIKHGFKGIYDGIIRYNEFRLTPWIFGTTGEMKKVLSTQGFYNKGALETILHNPVNIYRQYSLVKPLAIYQLAREAYEPAYTTYVPSLAVNEEQWVKNEKDDPKLMYDGAFYIKGEEYKGFFPLDELKGIQWITNDTERTSMTIQNEELGGQVFVIVDQLKSEMKAEINAGKPTFKLNIKIKGYVSNQNEKVPLPSEKLIGEMIKVIKKEVHDLHLLGIERKTDLFNFEHELFLHHTDYWKDNIKKSDFIIQEDTLESVNVEVELRHAGAGKNN